MQRVPIRQVRQRQRRDCCGVYGAVFRRVLLSTRVRRQQPRALRHGTSLLLPRGEYCVVPVQCLNAVHILI